MHSFLRIVLKKVNLSKILDFHLKMRLTHIMRLLHSVGIIFCTLLVESEFKKKFPDIDAGTEVTYSSDGERVIAMGANFGVFRINLIIARKLLSGIGAGLELAPVAASCSNCNTKLLGCDNFRRDWIRLLDVMHIWRNIKIA